MVQKSLDLEEEGCMFALTPEDPNPVCEAIRNVGGDAYVVKADRGTCKL